MSIKRRDNKNRILNNGESQRKDGRYAYKYIDNFGKTKFVYSWRLTEADIEPKGKKHDLSLREKEKRIKRDIDDGINTVGGDITLLELVEKYVMQKKTEKYNTQMYYKTCVSFLKRDIFSNRKITTIKKSDMIQWVISVKDKGYCYSTIDSVLSVVKLSFQLAIDDDLIRKNPCSFRLSNIIENDSVKREALDAEETERFLEAVTEYEQSHRSRYYDDIVILLNTGLRISELCGITIFDIDFERKIVNINKQLIKDYHCKYMVAPLKSKNAYREIPMNEKVCNSFLHIMMTMKKPYNKSIDNVNGFMFLDSYGNPKVLYHYDAFFKKVIKKYNQSHENPLPHITPHVLRHTYCTNLAHKGINPKVLQYLMGHSDISITLNLYTHATVTNAIEKLARISEF